MKNSLRNAFILGSMLGLWIVSCYVYARLRLELETQVSPEPERYEIPVRPYESIARRIFDMYTVNGTCAMNSSTIGIDLFKDGESGLRPPGRFAVLISGQTRTFLDVWHGMYKTLIEHNDIDVFATFNVNDTMSAGECATISLVAGPWLRSLDIISMSSAEIVERAKKEGYLDHFPYGLVTPRGPEGMISQFYVNYQVFLHFINRRRHMRAICGQSQRITRMILWCESGPTYFLHHRRDL